MNSYTKKEGLNKEGSLIINDLEPIGTVLTDVMKQVGARLLEGNFVDMMRFSRPARLTAPTTHLMCLTNDYLYSDLMIRASKEKDPIERMKLVTTFLISGLHINICFCKAKAPLNPILGETFQAVKKDGCKVYLEQSCHHPPTSNLYMIGPDKCFEIFGFSITTATMTGMNSIKGWREGKNLIKFKDGTLMSFTCPDMRINNLVLGERNVHYSGQYVVKDYQNKIESISTFAFKETGTLENVTSKIKGVFKTKEKVPVDQFQTTITKLNKTTKEKVLMAEGHGSCFGQIYFGGKKYWSFEDPHDEWFQSEDMFILPSDSKARKDYQALLVPNNYEKAQIEKDELENLQRADKKLREKNSTKK